MRRVHSMFPAFLATVLVACGGGGDASTPLAPITPASAGTTLGESISSKQTGNAYAVDIWLPPGYAQGTTIYPVVYAPDCEYRFTTLVSVLQQRIALGAPPMILVNVCDATTRGVDFTMPGATAYFRFLTQELIPFVEANWRASPSHRIFSGHSLGGEFAMYLVELDDPAKRAFDSVIAEDSSCFPEVMQITCQGAASTVEQAIFAKTQGNLPINLVIAGDTVSGGETNALVLENLFASRHYQGMHLTQFSYSLGHIPMDGPAFNDALGFILVAGP
jgi:hypothetical protein